MKVIENELICVRVNERPAHVLRGTTLAGLARRFQPDADIVIYNGFPVVDERLLSDGDRVVLIRRGEVPAREELEALLVARHGPGVHDRLRRARIGIAGCGGLGSTVALALARTGVGALVLADFDVVEPSNLNRQQYFLDQIGMHKVDALADTLARVSPYVEVSRFSVRVTGENAATLFSGCDVVAECFDAASAKADLARAMRSVSTTPLVAVSGIAGYGPAGAIFSRRVFGDWFLVGDNESEAEPGRGLLAPRVTVAAGHQANVVIRILLEAIPPEQGG